MSLLQSLHYPLPVTLKSTTARLLSALCFLCFVAFDTCLSVNKNREHQQKAKRTTRQSDLTTLCPTTDNEIPRNCHHALQLGNSHSGVYEIDPRDGHDSLKVYCDMKTDGGEWTVIQRRKDGSENFYRTWTEYEEGFGELYGEFWLGLDKIHRLAVDVTLRIDMMAPDRSKAYARYEDFTIGNSISKYVMYIGRYHGTAGDALSIHNGMKFTTKDQDNDQSSRNCAQSFSGAWWYTKCHSSNLNGVYAYGNSSNNLVVWRGFKYPQSLQKVEMKLK